MTLAVLWFLIKGNKSTNRCIKLTLPYASAPLRKPPRICAAFSPPSQLPRRLSSRTLNFPPFHLSFPLSFLSLVSHRFHPFLLLHLAIFGFVYVVPSSSSHPRIPHPNVCVASGPYSGFNVTPGFKPLWATCHRSVFLHPIIAKAARWHCCAHYRRARPPAWAQRSHKNNPANVFESSVCKCDT